MLIHNVTPDKGELTAGELDDIAKLEIEEVWYWYEYGHYEGEGWALMLKKGIFYLADLAHCSCNGPTDRISLDTGFTTLSSLLLNCSKQAQEKIEPIVNAARNRGWK